LHTSVKAKPSTVDPLNNAKAARGKSKSWPLGPVCWSAQSRSQLTTLNIPISLTGSPNTLNPILPFACPKSLSRTNSCAGNRDSWTLAQAHHVPIRLVGRSTLGLGLPGPCLELPNVPKPNPKGQVVTQSRLTHCNNPCNTHTWIVQGTQVACNRLLCLAQNQYQSSQQPLNVAQQPLLTLVAPW
jgi:hypothetical protein